MSGPTILGDRMKSLGASAQVIKAMDARKIRNWLFRLASSQASTLPLVIGTPTQAMVMDFQLPNVPSLLDSRFYMQALVIHALAKPFRNWRLTGTLSERIRAR